MATEEKWRFLGEKVNPTARVRTRAEADLAETEGFEPSVPNYQYDGLANRWFQPLTHVSTRLGKSGL